MDPTFKTDSGMSAESTRRVLPFRPRSGIAQARPRPQGGQLQDVPLPDLAQFERTASEDNYRHRMIVNAAALGFTVLLAGVGIWLAESMAALRKSQDCVLMGRNECNVVVTPSADRWSGTVSGQPQ
jgi:hypothetical protein